MPTDEACKSVCLFRLLSVFRAQSLITGDNLLSANRHAISSGWGGDNRFPWSFSRSGLIGVNNVLESDESRLKTLDMIEKRRKRSALSGERPSDRANVKTLTLPWVDTGTHRPPKPLIGGSRRR
jgi:hypothetical protein